MKIADLFAHARLVVEDFVFVDVRKLRVGLQGTGVVFVLDVDADDVIVGA